MPVFLTHPYPGIALLTICNPRRRNALGVEEFRQLAGFWKQLESDRALRCVVITGEGHTAFCSGAQLDIDFSGIADVDAMVDDALLKTRAFPRPVIAAVNGHCVAGGFELMLTSDIRIASETAKLGLPEVRWGIVPSGGGTMKLIEQIGYANGMRLLLTGELVSAREALAFGLVNEVLPSVEVAARALELARAITRNSALAVFHTKRLALQARQDSWQVRENEERLAAQEVRKSSDNRIGRAAFLSRIPPEFD